ncbi:hypothetical protein ACFSTI_24910 [Rhizorhabdus histidinilytica]|uniref:Uncharacterized protein n=1 Tax=Rhizorhabdus histidinilytica TaxID=439228 RepID=A0A1T5A8W3_9SPHN|nr:hypothetical protein [Rhizorhabdus histidinilytica]SKB31355.1 hypothetical protein SAMN06295920_101714 [Rhizorhabdus histidinilytica]
MAISKYHAVELSDEEPNGASAIAVMQVFTNAAATIEVRQEDDMIWMSFEHARALGEALLELTKDVAA